MSGLLRPLLCCQFVAWLTVTFVWLNQRCDSDDGEAAFPTQPKPPKLELRQPAWAADVIKAVEAGLQEAAGASLAGSNGGGTVGDRSDAAVVKALAEEIRALVAARAWQPGWRARDGGATISSGTSVVDERCPTGRGPVPLVATRDIAVAVLDPLDGKVVGKGLKEVVPSSNRWGVPMANVTVEVAPGKILTVDEVVYGYDLVFEAMHLFSYVSWGRVPMQQDPTDAMAIADLLGRLQPDCFVELGTNTGGGAIFYAEVMRGYQSRPLVVTIDVHGPTENWDKFGAKVCPHCVAAPCHPLWQDPDLIKFVQGYSQDPRVVSEVERLLDERQCQRTVVMHDSDHRRDTILKDLEIYNRFVQVGSYMVVQDTKLSRMRGARYATLEAVHEFLATPAGRNRFAIDKTFEYMLFSHHHDGFMQRIA